MDEQINLKQIGSRIRAARSSKGMSQADLAVKASVSLPLISNIELGTKVMSLETFVSIANALEVSTDSLLNRQLAVATEISNTEAQKLFSNCSPYETYVLLDVLKATKESLRAQRHHLRERNW